MGKDQWARRHPFSHIVPSFPLYPHLSYSEHFPFTEIGKGGRLYKSAPTETQEFPEDSPLSGGASL